MKLPVVSGKDFVKRLKKIGYELVSQEGSHMIIRLSSLPFTKLSVPNHKELDRGLLRSLIRDANLTVEVFGNQETHEDGSCCTRSASLSDPC